MWAHVLLDLDVILCVDSASPGEQRAFRSNSLLRPLPVLTTTPAVELAQTGHTVHGWWRTVAVRVSSPSEIRGLCLGK